MRDLGKDVLEIGLQLTSQLFKFFLSREDFNPLPDGSDWIDGFNRLKLEPGVL